MAATVTPSRILTIPVEMWEPMRVATQSIPHHFAWSSNHDTIPFTYWYHNYTGTTDANEKEAVNAMFFHPRGERIAAFTNFWMHAKRTWYPHAQLLRCISYVHTFEMEQYPHISLHDRRGERNLVVYLNKRWEAEWGGETRLYTAEMGGEVEQDVLPIGGTILDMPADQRHECLATTGTRASRISVVYRFKEGAPNAPPDRIPGR